MVIRSINLDVNVEQLPCTSRRSRSNLVSIDDVDVCNCVSLQSYDCSRPISVVISCLPDTSDNL